MRTKTSAEASSKGNPSNQKLRSPPIHLLLRLPPFVTIGARTINVVDAHNAVVQRTGSVALGKFGRPIAEYHLAKVNKQIADGVETRLYLVSKNGKEFISFSAPVSRVLAKSDYVGTIAEHPSYYQDSPSSWVILSGALMKAELRDLELASNSRKVLEVLSEARTPFMTVHKKAAR